MPLIWAGPGKLVGDAIPCEGTLYQRLVQPLLLAALNVDPPEGSAGLAGAVVRETLLAGGQACRPLIAREGLSAVLVEPALKLLQEKGASVQFGHELRGFGMSAGPRQRIEFWRRRRSRLRPTTPWSWRCRRVLRRRCCRA